MGRIRGRDTNPEMLVRRALYARGLRYRLHDRALPGHPDLVFTRRRAVLFVNGCFWHAHDCELFRLPGTRTDFWAEKLAGNRARDIMVLENLRKQGWRTLTIWECSFRGRLKSEVDDVAEEIVVWLRSDLPAGDIRGGMQDAGDDTL